MSGIRDAIRRETYLGQPITAGEVTVTPQSESLTIRWPYGGLVWQRPTGVLVERDGRVERMPILDVTRIILLALLGLSVCFGLVAWASRSKR